MPLESGDVSLDLSAACDRLALMAVLPCRSCGHRVFSEPPGLYDICPICFWQDDDVQLRWPDYDGGVNRPL
jgi:hypothetical protein